jgi:hypothetical protein
LKSTKKEDVEKVIERLEDIGEFDSAMRTREYYKDVLEEKDE